MANPDNPLANEAMGDDEWNPLYVWQLYVRARNHDEPIPEPVLQYLDECAYNLIEMMMEAPIEGQYEWQSKFAKAMFMVPSKGNRAGNYFTQFKRGEIKRMVGLQMASKQFRNWAEFDRHVAEKMNLSTDRVTTYRKSISNKIAPNTKLVTPTKAEQLRKHAEAAEAEAANAQKQSDRQARLERIRKRGIQF